MDTATVQLQEGDRVEYVDDGSKGTVRAVRREIVYASVEWDDGEYDTPDPEVIDGRKVEEHFAKDLRKIEG